MSKETTEKGNQRDMPFNAIEARKLSESNLSAYDLEKVLDMIRIEAKEGKTVLHLYQSISQRTIDQLNRLGYQLPPISPISSQKDGLCHSIHW